MEKTKKLEERLDLQWRTELQRTEERKNEQIEELMRNHEKAFMEMKNYYYTITANNINLIDELKVRDNPDEHRSIFMIWFYLSA